ncbi:response regulator transcription factor [Spirosoma sp. SC4-14]|uniref:response regulator transcription factor n=1 Tax=Spirosoma sp. SC4-14 TaxID=3128900 RepID=UPI0030D2662B
MHILVVEDEIKLVVNLKKELEEYAFQVTVALDGETARKAVEHGGVDFVIMDLNLPNDNGCTLCRDLRALNGHMPIILLSSTGSLDEKLSGFDAGADDFMVKPFEFSELLARIQVNRKRNQLIYHSTDTNLLVMGDLILDLRAKTVSRAGHSINITSRELALLEYFLRHKGEVLSREEIAAKVWSVPSGINTNLIDVYVYALRKKIDKDYKKKLIHTRVGMGYIMKEA